MTDPREQPVPFAVLIVCTANQCRSPMIEIMLRARLDELGIGWTIASAGTHARPGTPMEPPAADVLAERGFDGSGWHSRLLGAELIAAADLVLTAQTAHRSRVVELRPDALHRTFPLLQFARLAQHIAPLADPAGPDAGGLLVAGALAARSHVQPGGAADELTDPVGKRMRAYRACADSIAAAVDAVTAPLLAPAADRSAVE